MRDENGVVVGHEVTREPEWSPTDVRMMLAEYVWEKSLGPHGIPMDEALSPEADPANRSGAFRFVVPPPLVDYVQKAILDAEDAFKKDNPDTNTNGYIFQAVKKLRTSGTH